MSDNESKADSRLGPQIGNRIKAGLAAFVVSLSLAAPVVAGPLEDAVNAAKRRDYATALPLLRPRAEQGNSRAQGVIGLMYEIGKVVPQDYTEAAKWYRKAAEQGDRQAQYNLAIMYANGRGVPHDEAESDRWYRKAAEQGDASAQSLVGGAYLLGRRTKGLCSSLYVVEPRRPWRGPWRSPGSRRPRTFHDGRGDHRGAEAYARVDTEMTSESPTGAVGRPSQALRRRAG